MTVRFTDAEFPTGDWVSDGRSLRPWTTEGARELALEAMLLAQGAERAQVLLDLVKSRRDTLDAA